MPAPARAAQRPVFSGCSGKLRQGVFVARAAALAVDSELNGRAALLALAITPGAVFGVRILP